MSYPEIVPFQTRGGTPPTDAEDMEDEPQQHPLEELMEQSRPSQKAAPEPSRQRRIFNFGQHPATAQTAFTSLENERLQALAEAPTPSPPRRKHRHRSRSPRRPVQRAHSSPSPGKRRSRSPENRTAQGNASGSAEATEEDDIDFMSKTLTEMQKGPTNPKHTWHRPGNLPRTQPSRSRRFLRLPSRDRSRSFHENRSTPERCSNHPETRARKPK